MKVLQSALLAVLVVWTGLFPESVRAETANARAVEAWSAHDLYVPGEFVVRIRPAGRLSQLNSLNEQFGVLSIEPVFPSATTDLRDVYRLKVAPGTDIWNLALKYAESPEVAYAEPNLRAWLTARPNDPLIATQYNLHNVGQTGGVEDADVDAAEMLRLYIDNPPTYDPVVAVLDTGVELLHPDLSERVLEGHDFLDDDDDPSDTDGHGTGTASVVAAQIHNSQGIAGLCPNCSIRPVRVGSWVVHFGSVEVAQGIVYAADPAQGAADVISMSLGGTCSDLWTDAVDYAFDQDVLMVSAAGNYTIVVVYPAAYPRVMSVGATDERDEVPWWVPLIGTIDMHAPGVDVPVAERFGTYGEMTGTSSATPHVAATGAVLLGQNPALTATQVRQIIVDSADEKGGFLNRYLRLNAHRAMLGVQDPPLNPPDPPHEGCQLLPLGKSERTAIARMISDLDDSGATDVGRTLHRHRIQVGALVTVNRNLAERALQLAEAATAGEGGRTALRDFLETLARYASADLKAALNPMIRNLGVH